MEVWVPITASGEAAILQASIALISSMWVDRESEILCESELYHALLGELGPRTYENLTINLLSISALGLALMCRSISQSSPPSYMAAKNCFMTVLLQLDICSCPLNFTKLSVIPDFVFFIKKNFLFEHEYTKTMFLIVEDVRYTFASQA